MPQAEQPSTTARGLMELGITEGQLRGPGWRSPFHGIHAPVTGELLSTLQRIYDAAALLPPGGVLGGWAAAYLHGATDLDGKGWSGLETQPVVAMVPIASRLRRRDAVTYVRADLSDQLRDEVDGIPVTSRIRTAFDLARWSQPEDAVVALDTMARQAGVAPAAVADYASTLRRLRGLPRVAPAVDLADPRSRSVWESRYRYLWVVDAGFPRPRCNAYVTTVDGLVIACVDLLDEEAGMCGEYDGSTHRELENHTRDNVREEDVEELGLVVVRATSVDLWRPNRPATVTRLHRARARALAAGGGNSGWAWRPGPGPLFW
jgi:hypothetical protein